MYIFDVGIGADCVDVDVKNGVAYVQAVDVYVSADIDADGDVAA